MLNFKAVRKILAASLAIVEDLDYHVVVAQGYHVETYRMDLGLANENTEDERRSGGCNSYSN